MARDPQAALVALNRFGFGPRGGAAGDLLSAASDPRGFVKAELAKPNVALLEAPGLQDTLTLTQAFFSYEEELKQQREAAAKMAAASSETAKSETAKSDSAKPDNAKSGNATSENAKSENVKSENAMAPANKPAAQLSAIVRTESMPATPQMQPPKPPPQPLNVIQKTFRAEALARIQRASIADVGLVERLVAFWSNHFCVSVNKGGLVYIWAGAFEREAIRPHVLGRFGDMLKAVEQHPAMLFFLDNQQSIGPNSKAGQNGKRGLNENLAREIMELHTLGVGSGYTQEDVTTLARILTGWTFAGREGKLAPPGSFFFNPNAHEPGPQTLLRQTYEDLGLAQGEAALADLARKPATATFLATKFARHFVADDPPPALVARLAGVFVKTDGDLHAMTMALLDSDEAWRAPMTKMRAPYDYLIASGRLLGQLPEEPSRYLGGLTLLGQPLWGPAGPNGFADANAAWASPEGMKLRLDIASQVASRFADRLDARDLLEIALGPAASIETRQTVERAESRQQALTLLLMSPEFQRR